MKKIILKGKLIDVIIPKDNYVEFLFCFGNFAYKFLFSKKLTKERKIRNI